MDNSVHLEELKSIIAEGTRPVIVWAGSGLSYDAGMPTWAKIRESLTAELDRNARNGDPHDFDRLNAQAKSIKFENDPWVAFQRLKRELGDNTYKAVIKRLFSQASSTPPPLYERIWSLKKLRGIFTLNLDRFSAQSYSSVYKPHEYRFVEKSGQDIARLANILSDENYKFVANLHGDIDDVTSWVFTHDDLKKLHSNSTYSSMLQTSLSYHTHVFMGISVDDIAISSPIEKLLNIGVKNPSLFWVTPRVDQSTRTWAEVRDISLITYHAPNNDHSAVDKILDELGAAAPSEPHIVQPVISEGINAIDSDEPVEGMSIDDLRSYLNAKAKLILAPGTNASIEKYNDFVKDNRRLIHQASFIDVDASDGNKIFNITLEREVASGSFGQVYFGTDNEGRSVAVKVLLENVRRNPEYLQAFRRGVSSMRILQGRSIKGVVGFEDASEIPAFVSMEWVEGPTLAEFIESSVDTTWESKLEVLSQLSRIVHEAHLLPERVLHRDIRPQNIMLRDYWTERTLDVVVLDFDLSWHEDALDKSIVLSSVSGYLSPEQLGNGGGGGTRSASVDVFGIGMTAYHLISGKMPMPGASLAPWWKQTVDLDCTSSPLEDWHSFTHIVSRLISSCTEIDQSRRPDMFTLRSTVDSLTAILNNDFEKIDAEHLAEEIMASSRRSSSYAVNAETLKCEYSSPTGLSAAIGLDLSKENIEFAVEWVSTGVEARGGIGRYMGDRIRASRAVLSKSPWKVEKCESNPGAASIVGSCSVFKVREKFDECATAFADVLDKLTFEQHR